MRADYFVEIQIALSPAVPSSCTLLPPSEARALGGLGGRKGEGELQPWGSWGWGHMSQTWGWGWGHSHPPGDRYGEGDVSPIWTWGWGCASLAWEWGHISYMSHIYLGLRTELGTLVIHQGDKGMCVIHMELGMGLHVTLLGTGMGTRHPPGDGDASHPPGNRDGDM